MRTIMWKLDQIESIEAFHDRVEADLQPADAYGRNLDALYDLLSTLSEETQITVTALSEEEKEENHLRHYWEILQRVLCDAAEENPRIHVNWAERMQEA